MSTLVLELNDSGIGAALDDRIAPREPGYVLGEGSDLTFGAAALAQARVKPQLVSHHFWDTLDQDTLSEEGRWRQTPAELAFRQLEHIWARYRDSAGNAMIVVPACFTREQLGLILGMCRKAGIPVVSLIDGAVAALHEPPAGEQLVYVDLTLHRIVATRCTVGASLTRESYREIDQLGLNNFLGKWASAVADACVRSTRYDPMHSAAAEQTLYDSLPGLLERLGGSQSVSHEVTINNEAREVAIPGAALVQVVKPFYSRIVALIEELLVDTVDGANIVLSSRFAGFTGLVETLADVRGWTVSVLRDDAALLGVGADLAGFLQTEDAVGLITERSVSAVKPVPTAVRETVNPSHLLVDGEAYVLASSPFVVGTATREGSWGYRASGAVKGVSRSHCSIYVDGDRMVVRDHSSYGTFVNGQRIDGECRLSAGDVIRVGNPGVELRVVKEVACDGQKA